jgi:hypothetical protein
MKFSIKAVLAFAVVLTPALAFAQSGSTITRDQVRAQLVQLEEAGYNPLTNCTGDCPASLRRAEDVLSQRKVNADAAYGPALNGTAQSGQ